MKNWKDVRKELTLTEDDEKIISMEKELIRTMVSIREEQGVSQAALSDLEIVPIDKLYTRDELSKQLAIARKHAAEGKVMDAYEASDNVRRKYKLK